MAQAKREEPPAAAAPRAELPSTGIAEYRPNTKIPLPKQGKVSLGNWIGRVGNCRVRVYRGASAAKLPAVVVAAMQKSGIEVGVITWADLGVQPPDERRRSRVVEDDEEDEAET